MQRGILSRLNLKEGEIKHFTFKHLSPSFFKILSLHKYGNVRFYLNRTSPEIVTKIMKGDNIDPDYLEYEAEKKNRLLINPNHKMFCKGCLYLLTVKAMKTTESSLYLGDS